MLRRCGSNPLLLTVCICSLVLAGGIDIPQSPADDNSYLQLRNQTITARKYSTNYEELILGDGVTFALQRSATDGTNSLRLHEMTNGSLIVQLVFSPHDVFVDCDVSNSQQQMQRLTKHINSKIQRDRFTDVRLPQEEVKKLLDIDEWIDRCTMLHTTNLGKDPTEDIKPEMATFGSSESENHIPQQDDQLELQDRPKRGLTDLIYPGTKWCGRGSSAKHFEDLGAMPHTDRCCREHDQCTEVILPLSTSYSYFNYGILTISSCRCDRKFKRCLQNAAYRKNDALADMIGHLYFNVIGMKCFILEEQDHCAESSWWGRCLRTEKRVAASFREILTY